MITNLDLIAAKGVFDPRTAGVFAALALGGRVVFFGSWTLQQALLPLVIAEHPTLSKKLRKQIFFLGNAVVCTVLVGAGWIWADRWVELAFGGIYQDVATRFGPYALGTGLISMAAALAIIRSTEGDDRAGRSMLSGAVGVTVALFAAGHSLDTFVDVRLASLIVLVAVLGLGELKGQVSIPVPQRMSAPCRSDNEGVLL